jgi:hypothetical protein
MASEQPEAPRTRRKAGSGGSAPWLPPEYELADATALQALQVGKATPEQQKRALDWIIRQAAATYDFPYRPGDSDRDTNIALGRQFVGQQIVKLLSLAVGALRRGPFSDPHDPTA